MNSLINLRREGRTRDLPETNDDQVVCVIDSYMTGCTCNPLIEELAPHWEDDTHGLVSQVDTVRSNTRVRCRLAFCTFFVSTGPLTELRWPLFLITASEGLLGQHVW